MKVIHLALTSLTSLCLISNTLTGCLPNTSRQPAVQQPEEKKDEESLKDNSADSKNEDNSKGNEAKEEDKNGNTDNEKIKDENFARSDTQGQVSEPTPEASPNAQSKTQPKAKPKPKPQPQPKPSPVANSSTDSSTTERSIDAFHGYYYSAIFHNKTPGVSRSLEIKGTKFVSTAFGLQPGSMIVSARQVDEGDVKVESDGTVSLVVKSSTCDAHPDFVLKTAKRLEAKKLSVALNRLHFTYKLLDVERDGVLEKVKLLPKEASTADVRMYPGCWYAKANGDLAVHVRIEDL